MTQASSGAAKAAEAKSNAAPTKDSLVKEFGAAGLKESPDGKWEYNVTGAENVRRASDMMSGVRRIDVERGAEVQAGMQSETLRDHRGRDVHVPVHLAERAAMKRGLHAKPFWGKASYKCVSHGDGTYSEYERINGKLQFVGTYRWEDDRKRYADEEGE